MREVKIHTEYIELQQFLKLINAVQTGGEAKVYLYENTIYVNGIIESKRGRKLHPKDVVKTPDGEFVISNENQ